MENDTWINRYRIVAKIFMLSFGIVAIIIEKNAQNL